MTAFPSAVQLPADSDLLERIKSEQDLEKPATGPPMARLIAIWTNLPGATPITKFTDRKTAVVHIWKAMQTLEPTVGPSQHDTAPAAGNTPDQPSRKPKRDISLGSPPSG